MGKLLLGGIMNIKRLLDVREFNNLKQSDVAEILNVTQASYSRWETDIELIPLKQLSEFCNHFNVSMDYIMGLSRKNKSNGIHKLSKKEIGKKLKLLRKKYNITQTELADFLNTSQSTISAYESGRTTLLTSFALAICEKYKVSLDWLCGRENKK